MIISAIIGAFISAIGGQDVFYSILTIPFLYAFAGVFYKIAL
jgi:hypothetical protein